MNFNEFKTSIAIEMIQLSNCQKHHRIFVHETSRLGRFKKDGLRLRKKKNKKIRTPEPPDVFFIFVQFFSFFSTFLYVVRFFEIRILGWVLFSAFKKPLAVYIFDIF